MTSIGKIFVFSAPSGAGKNTLINYIRDRIPGIVYSISATTRSPRPREVNGRDYFFMSEEEFKRKIDEGAFVEWAVVHGHYYGTLRSFIEETVGSGRHIIMDIDVVGKKKLDSVYPDAIGILVVPPSMAELERRLRARNSDDEATIHLRLANASQELKYAKLHGKYEYTIVNNNLERAKRKTARLIRSLIES